MGTKPYNSNKKPSSAPMPQRIVTAEERALAAERLNQMSLKGYGDASAYFSAEQREKLMIAAGRNLLSK